MSDLTIDNAASIKGPTFNGDESKWTEYKIKMMAFLGTKRCNETLKKEFEVTLPDREDESLGSDTNGWVKAITKIKNALAMTYVTNSFTGDEMMNYILTAQD